MSGVATGEPLKIDVLVTDSMWVGLFDRLEFHRSRDGSGGPYSEMTAAGITPAVLSFLSRPYVVNTKVLSLQINESQQVDVTFSGADPIAAATIASQIQAQSSGLLTGAVSGGLIKISTVQAGANITIRVLSSHAAGVFGLATEEPDSVVFGKNARLTLIQGQNAYSFTDPHGSSDFYYKMRFSNSFNNTVSEFSDPFQAKGVTTLEQSDLITGTIDLVDLSGRAASNVRVLVHNRFNPALIDGKAVASSELQALTDENGHAEFVLARGASVTVAIAGTTIARDITVPTDPALSSFNMLDPSVGGQDVFKVVIPEYEYATRRAL